MVQWFGLHFHCQGWRFSSWWGELWSFKLCGMAKLKKKELATFKHFGFWLYLSTLEQCGFKYCVFHKLAFIVQYLSGLHKFSKLLKFPRILNLMLENSFDITLKYYLLAIIFFSCYHITYYKFYFCFSVSIRWNFMRAGNFWQFCSLPSLYVVLYVLYVYCTVLTVVAP